MRIVIATGIYPPEIGGPATYSAALAEALLNRGHQVAVVTYGSTRAVLPVAVYTVSRRGGAVVRYLRYAWRVFLLARKADIVYAQGAVSEGLPATIGAWFAKRPVVMRIPGDYAWEMARQRGETSNAFTFNAEKRYKRSMLVRLYAFIERWTARRAARVITPSEFLGSIVTGYWGVPPEKEKIIRNAIDPLPSTDGRDVERKKFGVEDKTVILTVVRAVPWKGVEGSISWWSSLPETHLLVVAGDGPELEKWKQKAIACGVRDRVRFLGRIDRQTLAHWYEAADAFVLNSQYEGWPFVVTEAVSMGLPCLVSREGGNPETHRMFPDFVKEPMQYDARLLWIPALEAIKQRMFVKKPILDWTFEKVVDETERVLTERPIRMAMISYEKGFLDRQSDASRRLSSLAQGIEIAPIVISGKKFFSSIRAGIRYRPTVVTAQDPFGAGLIGYVISRWTNAPLEIQEHADFFSGEFKRGSFKNTLWTMVGSFILKRAERVRAVSERVKENLINIGVQKEKIEVIPVAQGFAQGPNPLTLRALPLRKGETLRIVAPCRFVSQKGLDVLIEAAAILMRDGRDFNLTLMGQGSLESSLRDLIKQQKLQKRVRIEPWKNSDELWRDADLFVMSSRYEGWGRTIVEAMAAGVPIVTTEVGCVGSFFRPNVDGLAVPVGDTRALADAIERQMDHLEERGRMRLSAFEQAKTFPSHKELHSRQRDGWRGLLNHRADVGPRFDLWIAAFLVFAVLSRAASVILFQRQLLNREWGFFTLVDSWFKGFGYSFAHQAGCASAYRSPGFLFFLTALYSIFSPSNTWAQAIIQNLFVIGVLWLVYAVGKRLVGRRAALVGAFLMAAYPYTFYHYTQYYHTFLSSFFLLLLIWFLLKLEESRRFRHAFGAGIALACLAYVQGTILPAMPPVVVWLIVMWRPDWKRTMIAAFMIAATSVAMIAPWTYRNWTVFHRFVPLTTDLGFGLAKANNENIFALTKFGYPQEVVDVETVSATNPGFVQYRLEPNVEEDLRQRDELRPSIFWTEWHPREPAGQVPTCAALGPMNEYAFNRYWTGRATQWIKTNWFSEGWKLQLLKLKTFWQPSLFPSVKMGAPWPFSGWKEEAARWSVTIMSAIVIFGGWIGIIWKVKRRDRRVWLPLIIILTYTFMHTWFAGYTKYRIPLDNLMVIYAGWTIIRVFDWIRGSFR